MQGERLYDKIAEAVEYIRKSGYTGKPQAAMIFGSGLSEISCFMDVNLEILYEEIPGFMESTLEFHPGKLLFGNAGGRSVVAMDGRYHHYEGYSLKEITFPVRVMRMLGAETLMLSNLAGGLNPDYKAGDIILISDHINMIGENPLTGRNDERLGLRFPDMIEPYSRRLMEIADKTSMMKGLRLNHGVYLALSGPSFETKAEYRMLRILGADLVGMSSVPEVIAAVHGGMEVLGLSLISDECFPDCLEPLDIEVLLGRASEGSNRIAGIFEAVLSDPDFERV